MDWRLRSPISTRSLGARARRARTRASGTLSSLPGAMPPRQTRYREMASSLAVRRILEGRPQPAGDHERRRDLRGGLPSFSAQFVEVVHLSVAPLHAASECLSALSELRGVLSDDSFVQLNRGGSRRLPGADRLLRPSFLRCWSFGPARSPSLRRELLG